MRTRWEDSTPYIQDYRQWFRFANVLVMRVQEASKRGRGERAWFNWQIAVRRPGGGFNEALSIEEGGAKSCAAAKQECDIAAYAILAKLSEALRAVGE